MPSTVPFGHFSLHRKSLKSVEMTVFGRGKAKSRPGVITAPTHKSA